MATLDEMIDNILSNGSSKSTYRSWLKKCFRLLNENPETYFNKTVDEICQDTLTILKIIEKDPPKTKQGIMYSWKSLLSLHDITLKPSIIRIIKNKTKGHSISEVRIITTQMLKEILSTAGVKERAFFLFLATSGIRIGEALKLRVDEHLELTHDPPLVRITSDIAEKGDKRITFITDEAKEYLLKWIKQRDRYIEDKKNKCNFKKKMNLEQYNDRVFPFSSRVVYIWWERLLDKSGYLEIYKKTKRKTMVVHQLRSYFRSALGPIIKQDVIEALMGHTNELQRSYRRYTEAKLANYYKQGISALYVFKTDIVSKEEFDMFLKQI